MTMLPIAQQFTPAALIALGALLLLLVAAVAWRWWLLRVAWRGRKAAERTPRAAQGPGVSVIMVAHNAAADLEELLPLLMEQNYAPFEVIVVMDNCTDATADVLKALEAAHPRLHHSFIPATARYVSHEKLGLTIGAKAARYDWLLFTQPNCRPAGPEWIARMAATASDDCDIVLGYANYASNGRLTTGFHQYMRALLAMKWMHAARRKALGGDGCNLMLRRDHFLAERGYAGGLTLLCGADDLLVEKLASRGRTRVCLAPAAFVGQRIGERRHARLMAHLSRRMSLGHLRLAHRLRLRVWGMAGIVRLLAWIYAVALAAWVLLARSPLVAATVGAMLAVYVLVQSLMWRCAARSLHLPVRVTFFYDLMRLVLWPKWLLQTRRARRDFMRKA